jgi:predicted nucleic acid-binding protein
MAIVAGIRSLSIVPPVEELALCIIQDAQLPGRAAADAVHIAVAAVHRIDYLLTWNVRHIANAEVRRTVEAACRAGGFTPPVLCTPEELMGL